MSEASREMTLEEWVNQLPAKHGARDALASLKLQLDKQTEAAAWLAGEARKLERDYNDLWEQRDQLLRDLARLTAEGKELRAKLEAAEQERDLAFSDAPSDVKSRITWAIEWRRAKDEAEEWRKAAGKLSTEHDRELAEARRERDAARAEVRGRDSTILAMMQRAQRVDADLRNFLQAFDDYFHWRGAWRPSESEREDLKQAMLSAAIQARASLPAPTASPTSKPSGGEP